MLDLIAKINVAQIFLYCMILQDKVPLNSKLVKMSLIQGAPYVFERFLEAALRPWMDSDKIFVDKKIA